MNDYLPIGIALKTAMNAPCSAQVREILMQESQAGNTVKAFDKVSLGIDETYYILLFNDKSNYSYPNLSTRHKLGGDMYQVFSLTNHAGCVEIRFGY